MGEMGAVGEKTNTLSCCRLALTLLTTSARSSLLGMPPYSSESVAIDSIAPITSSADADAREDSAARRFSVNPAASERCGRPRAASVAAAAVEEERTTSARRLTTPGAEAGTSASRATAPTTESMCGARFGQFRLVCKPKIASF